MTDHDDLIRRLEWHATRTAREAAAIKALMAERDNALALLAARRAEADDTIKGLVEALDKAEAERDELRHEHAAAPRHLGLLWREAVARAEKAEAEITWLRSGGENAQLKTEVVRLREALREAARQLWLARQCKIYGDDGPLHKPWVTGLLARIEALLAGKEGTT